MKKVIVFCFILCLTANLSACGRGGGENADIVFINDSKATIGAVLVEFQDQSGGTQNADSSPLKRGETFGFEAGEYPATLAVYETPPEPFTEPVQKALASIVIREAPPEGERWYVTARDGGSGLTLMMATDSLGA